MRQESRVDEGQALRFNQFILRYQKYFKPEDVAMFKGAIQKRSDADLVLIEKELKSPTLAVFLSIFLGYIGVERFYVGRNGTGFLKALIFLACLGLSRVISMFDEGGFSVLNSQSPIFDPGNMVFASFLYWTILFVWCVVDWFLIASIAKGKNLETLLLFKRESMERK